MNKFKLHAKEILSNNNIILNSREANILVNFANTKLSEKEIIQNYEKLHTLILFNKRFPDTMGLNDNIIEEYKIYYNIISNHSDMEEIHITNLSNTIEVIRGLIEIEKGQLNDNTLKIREEMIKMSDDARNKLNNILHGNDYRKDSKLKVIK